jgi:hypothetical protein
VSYWRSAPDATAAPDADALVDATHNIAWHDWRLFGGLTTMAFHDDTTADTSLIAHGDVAYRPDDGLQVEWALQRTRNEITDTFDDDQLELERLEMRVAIDAAPLCAPSSAWAPPPQSSSTARRSTGTRRATRRPMRPRSRPHSRPLNKLPRSGAIPR